MKSRTSLGSPLRAEPYLRVLLLVAACVVSLGDEADAARSGLDDNSNDNLEITAVAGSGEAAPAGTVLSKGPAVAIEDENGSPVPGVEVRFSVTDGGGKVDPRTVATNREGRAGTVWILGGEAGSMQVVKATAEDESVRIEATTEAIEPGQRHAGRKGYVEWQVGDLSLIISAPHGGGLEPDDIPDRSRGVTVQDSRTQELALAIRKEIQDRTGRQAHLVFSRLHREKLDPNREIEEAAQNCAAAERAWYEYHSFLQAASASVETTYNAGLLIDIHGTGHDIQRNELGYALSEEELALSDEELASGSVAAESSIRDLSDRSSRSFPELLRGETSVGGLLGARGYAAVPSFSVSDPAGAPYFNGGYITRRYGSTDGGTISAIQMEHTWRPFRATQELRKAYAVALVDALLEFFPVHFGWPLDADENGTSTMMNQNTGSAEG